MKGEQALDDFAQNLVGRVEFLVRHSCQKLKRRVG
jgi:hypothetical protein